MAGETEQVRLNTNDALRNNALKLYGAREEMSRLEPVEQRVGPLNTAWLASADKSRLDSLRTDEAKIKKAFLAHTNEVVDGVFGRLDSVADAQARDIYRQRRLEAANALTDYFLTNTRAGLEASYNNLLADGMMLAGGLSSDEYIQRLTLEGVVTPPPLPVQPRVNAGAEQQSETLIREHLARLQAEADARGEIPTVAPAEQSQEEALKRDFWYRLRHRFDVGRIVREITREGSIDIGGNKDLAVGLTRAAMGLITIWGLLHLPELSGKIKDFNRRRVEQSNSALFMRDYLSGGEFTARTDLAGILNRNTQGVTDFDNVAGWGSGDFNRDARNWGGVWVEAQTREGRQKLLKADPNLGSFVDFAEKNDDVSGFLIDQEIIDWLKSQKANPKDLSIAVEISKVWRNQPGQVEKALRGELIGQESRRRELMQENDLRTQKRQQDSTSRNVKANQANISRRIGPGRG